MKREWWQRGVIVGLLVLIVGVPFVLRPAQGEDEAATGPDAPVLVIVSPHNEQIRSEFAAAFNAWRTEQGQPRVNFDWRTSGGTSDLRKMIIASYEAEAARAAQENRPIGGVGYDLFFGGGEHELNILARGIEVVEGGERKRLPLLVPVAIPEPMIAEVFPDPSIGSQRLYHPELRWVGAALSSFGIVYNRDLLGMIGRPEPETWADLQHEAYLNQLALADPGHSGSIAATYEAIVRRLGWVEGWALLRRIFANARYFTSSAGKVPVDVSAGEAAAGMCIDFYGRFQEGAIGGGRIGYVDPAFMTSINADPIGILHGAPSQQRAVAAGAPASSGLANQFVLWVLSEPAQMLWQKRLGTEGGPRRFELRRLPVRRGLYVEPKMTDWADRVNPFSIAKPFPAKMPSFYPLIGPLSHAMAIDVHDDLRAAWATLARYPDHPRRAEMLALFDALPPELTPAPLSDDAAGRATPLSTLLQDPTHPAHHRAVDAQAEFAEEVATRYGGYASQDKLDDDRLRWTLFFRDNYRRIAALGGE